jgi:hypothetical protein
MDLHSLHHFALDRLDLETRRLKSTRSKTEEVSKLAFRTDRKDIKRQI